MAHPGAWPTPRGEPLYLTIDQGGQSSRVLVFDQAGSVRASQAVAVDTVRPRSGWVEQNPVVLLDSVTTCLAAIAEELGERTADIQAAGLATQRSSVVCWDRVTGEALSSVLSWQDRRGEPQVRELRSQAPRVGEITGLVLSSHYGASKIRWCLDHLSAVRNALHQGRLACGPLASYLLFHLCPTQPFVVDPAIANRTLLWDQGALDWSPELLNLFGVPAFVLPDCVPSRHDFGSIRLGGSSIPLTTSTGDQSAAFFVEGLPHTEIAIANLGTGGFVQRRWMTRVASVAGLLGSVVWHDGNMVVRTLEGSINGCGSALAKVGATFGFDSASVVAHADKWLAGDSEPPLFLNGVSGLGSPYWVADFESQILGSGAPGQIMVAVFESILFLLRINLELMSRQLGVPARILVTGGLATSDRLCQRLADLTGIETVRSEIREATALGLARLMAGRFENVRGKDTVDHYASRPSPELEKRFQRWRSVLESRLPPERPTRDSRPS